MALYISEKLRGYTIKGVLRKVMVSFCFVAIAVLGAYEAKTGYAVFISWVCFSAFWGTSGSTLNTCMMTATITIRMRASNALCSGI